MQNYLLWISNIPHLGERKRHTHTRAYPHTLKLAHTQTHTHTHTLKHNHTHTDTHTHTYTHTHIHTHTHTHKHAHIHTHLMISIITAFVYNKPRSHGSRSWVEHEMDRETAGIRPTPPGVTTPRLFGSISIPSSQASQEDWAGRCDRRAGTSHVIGMWTRCDWHVTDVTEMWLKCPSTSSD